MSNFDEFDEYDEELENYITLTDDEGNEFSLEFVDLIEYKEKEYAVFLPVDEESEEVVILEITESDDDEIQEYRSVEDEDILNEVFEIFKEKFKDDFKFE